MKIARDMKNTGNRLPSCSCFFFAYLAKKKITIIAITIAVKNGQVLSVQKIDNKTISRPFILNQNLFIVKDNGIIKLN